MAEAVCLITASTDYMFSLIVKSYILWFRGKTEVLEESNSAGGFPACLYHPSLLSKTKHYECWEYQTLFISLAQVNGCIFYWLFVNIKSSVLVIISHITLEY